MASQGGFIILQALMGALELPVVLKMQTFWLWWLVAFGLVLVPMLGKLQIDWYRGGWAFHWTWQEFVWWIAGVPWFYWWWLCGSLFKVGKRRPLAPGYQGPSSFEADPADKLRWNFTYGFDFRHDCHLRCFVSLEGVKNTWEEWKCSVCICRHGILW